MISGDSVYAALAAVPCPSLVLKRHCPIAFDVGGDGTVTTQVTTQMCYEASRTRNLRVYSRANLHLVSSMAPAPGPKQGAGGQHPIQPARASRPTKKSRKFSMSAIA